MTSVPPQSARLAQATTTPEEIKVESPVKAAEATGALPTFRWPVRGKVITSYGAKTNGKSNDGINLAVPEGTPVTFVVGARGPRPLSYQWQREGVDIPLGTGESLTLAAPGISDHDAHFWVRVRDATGHAVTSRVATLWVEPLDTHFPLE